MEAKNNMLLNNEWVKNEIKEEIQRYLETMKMRTWWPQICGTQGKAILREKFIALQACLKKQEKAQINNLTVHLKEFENEKQVTPKVSRR